jgi:ribosomal protein S18 acetylase RimI-like enzyme
VAASDDWPAIWPIFEAIIRPGDTYTYPSDLDKVAARSIWMVGPPGAVLVAVDDDGTVLGSARVQPVQPGRGSHVANGSFIVDPAAGGRGIGRALAEHTIAWAAEHGYRAMQFNAVVETNDRAVALWRSLGFEILTTIPEAFDHPTHGLVGLHVMHRPLP